MKKLKFLGFFVLQVFFEILPIAWEKTDRNLSDYNQFLFKKRFEVNKKQIFFSEKMRNSDNCVYDYAHSFFGDDF